MLELLAVLLIMAMSLGVFLGYNFRQRDTVLLRTTAREVHQWIRVQRSHALLDGLENHGWYHIHEHALRSSLRGHQLGLPESVRLVLPEGEQREIVPVTLFHPDGSAELSNILLRLEDRDIAVHVDPVLGESRVQW